MALLECSGVTRYFGGLGAVADVSFQVDQGEIVGLIGPNGAGKTTLFSLIAGSISLTSGSVRFRQQRISGLRPDQVCREGVVRTFQAGNLFPKMTVMENVVLGCLFGSPRKVSAAQASEEASVLLELVGLQTKSRLLARDLTLAAQKRLEIARALATKPSLLMLDEVMAGLNLTEVGQSLELIRRIREQGTTVFLIEHVMKAIMNVSERILVLHHGEKIAEGTPEEVANSRTVINVYLGE